MEAIVALAGWKSSTEASGNECAAVTGARKRQRCCAARLAVALPLCKLKHSTLERAKPCQDSKLPVLGMRPLSQSASSKISRKAALMPPLCVRVSHAKCPWSFVVTLILFTFLHSV